jgi:hypothetical protein
LNAKGLSPEIPEGILFNMIRANGQETPLRILTDTGCGIPCISSKAVRQLKLQISSGMQVRVLGVAPNP